MDPDDALKKLRARVSGSVFDDFSAGCRSARDGLVGFLASFCVLTRTTGTEEDGASRRGRKDDPPERVALPGDSPSGRVIGDSHADEIERDHE